MSDEGTYIFCQEIGFVVCVYEDAGVAALVAQRLLTAQVGVFATYGVAGGYTNLGLFVVTAVNVHPHNIFVRGFVIDDFGAFDDTILACIT